MNKMENKQMFVKKFKKILDKRMYVWYNKDVNKKRPHYKLWRDSSEVETKNITRH